MRPDLPDQLLHVIQRGNNRGLYRDWLAAVAANHGCAIHACVLITDHLHLLVTSTRADSAPRMMQVLGRRYVRHVNITCRRTGTLWEGRYPATPIDRKGIPSSLGMSKYCVARVKCRPERTFPLGA